MKRNLQCACECNHQLLVLLLSAFTRDVGQNDAIIRAAELKLSITSILNDYLQSFYTFKLSTSSYEHFPIFSLICYEALISKFDFYAQESHSVTGVDEGLNFYLNMFTQIV